MCSRVFIFLIGAVQIYHQVFAADTFAGAMTIESNITLDSNTLLSFLNNLALSNVTILQNVLTTDCLIIGPTTNCTCSAGYTWSNDVCYSYNCCTETPCIASISYMQSLCVFKVNVQINGKVSLLGSSNWDNTKTLTLQKALAELNGFQNLTIRQNMGIAEFNAAVSVRINTTKLQDIMAKQENSLNATILATTSGMVTIVSPNTSVCYQSNPVMKCTIKEATDNSGWTMMRNNASSVLNPGSVVGLNKSCATQTDLSCIKLVLTGVTGAWAGVYQCAFTTGRITHTATTQLSVTLLPDVITMTTDPLIGDCSNNPSKSTINISVNAIIPNSTENYWVSWNGELESQNTGKPTTNGQVYEYVANLICNPSITQNVNVTFKNTKGQKKNAQVIIPVIYAETTSCNENKGWPKTPSGVTVNKSICEKDTVGYQSRTCQGSQWGGVISFCVNKQLNQVSDQAEDFKKGLGATPQMAINIFEGLLNTSVLPSSGSFANIHATINILNVMASASAKTGLQDAVLPNFIQAASNMLDKHWDDNGYIHSMSANYLQSVESLVKNIQVSNSTGANSSNLQLKYCSTKDCNVSVFDIGVNLTKTSGTLKALAINNLSDKLQNIDSTKVPTSLILSATLENNSDSSLEITLDFPIKQLYSGDPSCVFWNITEGNWSSTGCMFVNNSDANQTRCKCDHLTPFSVLMSKNRGEMPDSTGIEDIMTSVGLGVSICSLLIFLIIEAIVWSAVVKTNLSHFRHTAMVNIAMFLLLADCSFLASTSPTILSDDMCLVLTICKHLFYLAMFCWMLCMSFMLVHQLIFVFSPLRKTVFMIFSSFVGYICPIVIVGSSYVYYTKKDYYDKKTCWLIFNRLLVGSMHAFLLPVGTIILTNIFCMMVVILTLVKSSVPDGSVADEKETAKSILKVVVFLTPVFGVTWVIGFVQLILSEDSPMYGVARHSFTILNSFQGLFILLTGFLSEQKVRNELCRMIKGKSNGKSDSMKNLISSKHTDEK